MSNGDDDLLHSKTALSWAAGCSTFAAVGGHIAINWLPWEPVIGAVISIVALAAFAGLYVASRRARIAVASSFLLTFLITFSYVLTVDDFAESIKGNMLVDDFRNIVTIIVGFYFGSEAAVGVAKAIGTSRMPSSTPQDVRKADRDLSTPAATSNEQET
ncbi:hypothetical protein ACIHCQ_43560 [Streptomyces sp. NPDC052236]|uniref:hypothetical protein n=1 Tax=Streptomyces sp. NPDC052236 TaxID=3365686 RepID=UPI0037CFBBCD